MRAEHLLRLVVGQRRRGRRRSALDDARPRSRRCSRRRSRPRASGSPTARGEQALREAVDLRAVVVEVVLAGDLGALRLEHAGEAVADRRPAARRRGGSGRSGSRRRTRGSSSRPRTRCRGRTPPPPRRCAPASAPALAASRVMLMKPGAGDVDRGDAGERAEVGRELLREVARRHADPLRDAHRDGARPVAVLAGARALQHDLGVGDGQIGPASRGGRPHEIAHGDLELGRSHGRRAYRRPTRRIRRAEAETGPRAAPLLRCGCPPDGGHGATGGHP